MSFSICYQQLLFYFILLSSFRAFYFFIRIATDETIAGMNIISNTKIDSNESPIPYDFEKANGAIVTKRSAKVKEKIATALINLVRLKSINSYFLAFHPV
jgi:hypothetical protein